MKRAKYILFLLFPLILEAQITNGLVLYVDAGDSSSYSGSGNTWNDISGNNNNGTITGATFNSTNKWFDFDGNDRVNFAAALAGGDDTYTLEAYFNADSRRTQVVVEQNHGSQSGSRRACMLLISNGNGGFNGEGNDRHNNVSYSLNSWEHWVIVANATSNSLKMYRNGSIAYNGTFANAGALNVGTGGVSIGYKLPRNNEYFDGQIKFVRIYDRTLSDNEVSQNYQSISNSAPSDILLSSNSFDENIPSGTIISTLTATDSDNGDSHTFTLSSGNGSNDSDNSDFIINGSSLKTSGTFDFESKSSYNIYINTNDGAADFAKAFTLTVNDIDEDLDNDGITGVNDNCPNTANPNQSDIDGDGIGDACDPDVDGDGVANTVDNCPRKLNPRQLDNDKDGIGDVCDPDDDNDGYPDSKDYFPLDSTEWFDNDLDGIGDNADTDDDNDGYLDTEDAFPLNPKEWLDTDGDGIGNNLDKDDDNDNVIDRKDAFPLDSSEWLDTDSDGVGNNTDEDDDGDGYSDLVEIECGSSPIRKFFIPSDYDNDLIADCVDPDDDNDGCLDEEDLWPYNENACADSDGDGIADYYDYDSDNDGVPDDRDAFPNDPSESIDTDGDGIGDNADPDDNNDGFPENPVTNQKGEEVIPLFVSELLTPNQPGVESKWRIVNIEKYPSANVKVYSTNWNVVYESWSYKNNWDGKDKKGNLLPSGPYYYIIDRGDETTVEEGWMYIFN